jgi:hypothetical protein
MKFVAVVAALGALACPAAATVGVDVSDALSEKDFKCLEEPGGHGPVKFVSVRAYESLGRVDPNAVGTIKAALAAGIKHVDAYLFPDVKGNAASQVAATHEALAGSGYGMLWYDIERLEWSSNLDTNRAFVKELVDAGKQHGIHAGICACLPSVHPSYVVLLVLPATTCALPVHLRSRCCSLCERAASDSRGWVCGLVREVSGWNAAHCFCFKQTRTITIGKRLSGWTTPTQPTRAWVCGTRTTTTAPPLATSNRSAAGRCPASSSTPVTSPLAARTSTSTGTRDGRSVRAGGN